MSNLLGGSVRALRSIFPTGLNEEKINFARFRNDACPTTDATELSNFHANGSVSKGTPGDEKGPYENGGTPFPTYVEEDTASEGQDTRNQISEWQAGWNVTNAIQVKFFSNYLS